MAYRERARQYLEDYSAGQIYRSARMTIDKDQIIAFAGQFDPQPYHLDEEAAHKSVFGGLAASGWHTAALSSAANSGRRTVSWEWVLMSCAGYVRFAPATVYMSKPKCWKCGRLSRRPNGA